MAGTSPAMTPRKWFNMSGIRYSLRADHFHTKAIVVFAAILVNGANPDAMGSGFQTGR